MPSDLIAAFEARLQSGALSPDAAQREALVRLSALARELEAWRPHALFGLLRHRRPPPRGLYIHGKVGRGKTMLMDLFYDAVRIAPKRRVHFHAFMSEVHAAITAARKSQPGDPIPIVAEDLAAQAKLLCFDEFHVTDIADAMLLGRLFTALFEHHVIVVATSNVPPSGLYRDGLNRQLFLPFIALLEDKLDVLELVAARDYRLDKLAGQPRYFTPLDAAAHTGLRGHFTRLTGQVKGTSRDLDVGGRKVRLAEVAEGTVYATFEELCAAPLGAEDYLRLAAGFHTLILEGVPILHAERRTEARRFITLIDTLYDAGTTLIVSAEAEPHELHPDGDQAFLFERTASRLMDMRSQAYLDARRTAGPRPHADRVAG